MVRRTALFLIGAALFAAPALADVKAGVDAWERGDYREAVKQWRPLAIAGDADAQHNLGQAYARGNGVPVDMKMAESWYRKAALQGLPEAEANYGLALFQNGSRAEAVPWLEKAVARGEPRAQYVLGTALFNGDIVAKDWVRGYALMTRASSSGLDQASKTLAQMDQYIPLSDRQKGGALARQLELAAMKPVVSPSEGPAPSAIVRPAPRIAAVDLPPSRPVASIDESPRAIERVDAPRPPVATPKPAPAKAGAWRIQLGAFGDAARARALWSSMERNVGSLKGLQPYLVKAGPVTRLQAGPIASRAAADKQCAAVKGAGQACLVVAPG